MAKKVNKTRRRKMTEEDHYRAQDDLRIIRQANEIAMDKKRLSAAQREADKEMAALKKVKARKGK